MLSIYFLLPATADSDILDICEWSDTSYAEGYIKTPNYPDKYPGNELCACTLWTTDGGKVKLESQHFLIKVNLLCNKSTYN